MSKYDKLISIFQDCEYGKVDTAPSPERILQRYHLFPNEAIYIVDYKNAEIEPLTKNFDQICGIDSHHRHATILYDHVNPKDIKPFLRHIERLLFFGFKGQSKTFQEEKDFNLTLYRTAKDRVILKSTAIIGYDSLNQIRYSVGKLMDVTGLIPYHGFSYKFVGPGSLQTYAAFEGVNEFSNLLTKRELEILVHVGRGFTSGQIAEKFSVSRHTIDTHKRNIIHKLEAANSIDAYNKAQDLGLFR